jgi:hypothetical protein
VLTVLALPLAAIQTVALAIALVARENFIPTVRPALFVLPAVPVILAGFALWCMAANRPLCWQTRALWTLTLVVFFATLIPPIACMNHIASYKGSWIPR